MIKQNNFENLDIRICSVGGSRDVKDFLHIGLGAVWKKYLPEREVGDNQMCNKGAGDL